MVTVTGMRESAHTLNDSPYDPPTPRRVMEILNQAGETGATGPDIARYFTIPDPPLTEAGIRCGKRATPSMANLQRRLTWTNQILRRFWRRGWSVRGELESSPYYNNVPTFRWYITDTGAEYLAGGMAAGLRAAREQEHLRRSAERAGRQKHLDDLISQAYIDFDPATTYKCERTAAMRTLRDAGCSLASIGGVFDVTRERVRQILTGHRVGPCRCPRCTEQRRFQDTGGTG